MILIRLSEEKGVSLNIKYTRMQQVYAVPIHLTPDITYEGVLTGTLLPVRTSIASTSQLIPFKQLLAGFAIQRLIIKPFQYYEELRELKNKRVQYAKVIAQRRREAQVRRLSVHA